MKILSPLLAAVMCLAGCTAPPKNEPTVPTAPDISATTTAPSAEAAPHLISHVPHILQTAQWPTGCESVSAVALLQYWGEKITVDDFIDGFLPTAPLPSRGADGQLRGESPWECFPGDPRSPAGYGCYAPVIARAMEACCGGRLTVQLLLDTDLSTLCRYVAEDTPVLIWATMGMLPAYEGQHWLLPDGSTFTFVCPEHALLLIGFDESRCYFSDPQRPDAVTAYSRAKTEAAFAAMGGQAIVCRPK